MTQPISVPNPSALRRALRHAAIGFAASAALVAGAQGLLAAGIGSHDTNAPVNYAADRIELNDKAKRVTLSGNVVITQADLRLTAARSTLAYTDEPSLKLHRMDASGGVDVLRGGERATGDMGIYDFDRRIITLFGNVRLRRGTDTLNGGRLVIDLDTGLSSMDGRASGASPALGGGVSQGSGGRVSGTFAVPEKSGTPRGQ